MRYSVLLSTTITLALKKPFYKDLVVVRRMLSAVNLVDYQTVLNHVYNDEIGLQNIFSVQVTGGCSNLLHWLFVVPGASKAIVETAVPYSNIALSEQIGIVVQACSSETAIKLSERARRRAIELYMANTLNFRSLLNVNTFGISCTAALATSRPKKGDHRCFIASSTMSENIVYNINFIKDRNTRVGEDTLCSVFALQMIANSSSSFPPLSPAEGLIADLSSNGIQSFSTETIPKLGLLHRLYTKTINHALVLHKSHSQPPPETLTIPFSFPPNLNPTATTPTIASPNNDHEFLHKYSYFEDVSVPPGSLIFSGSFNPLHQGHIDLVQAAVKAVRNHRARTYSLDSSAHTTDPVPVPVIFEIAIINADKPPLTEAAVMQRLSQFSVENPLFRSQSPPLANFAVSLTTEPLFLQKATIFRNCYFVIGIDTYLRLIDVKYYQYNILEMIAALSSMQEKGIKFVVGGRTIADTTLEGDHTRFLTLQDLLSQKEEKGGVDAQEKRKETEEAPGEGSPPAAGRGRSTVPGRVSDTALPPSLQSMFIGITESEFRRDVSSTEIRRRQQQQQQQQVERS